MQCVRILYIVQIMCGLQKLSHKNKFKCHRTLETQHTHFSNKKTQHKIIAIDITTEDANFVGSANCSSEMMFD